MKRLIIILVLGIYCLMGYSQKTGSFIDPRDGKTYKTVRIGSQWIMAENLAYKPTKGKYWAIKNKEANTPKYGYLYTWDAAISIAPKGWHLPTIDEWDIFYKYLQGNIDGIGYKDLLPGGVSGFNLVFPGVHGVFGFMLIDKTVMFRSSTPYRRFQFQDSNTYDEYNSNDEAFINAGISVRLFKDLSDYDMWDWAKTVNSEQGYKDYIQLYQNSVYADSASIMIAQIQEKAEQNIENAKNAGEKIVPGVSLEEVISLLSMDEFNRDSAGGIWVGMGVFPQNANEKSTYTGDASLDGYDIVFEKGKVVSKKLVSERLGSKKANFGYTIK